MSSPERAAEQHHQAAAVGAECSRQTFSVSVRRSPFLPLAALGRVKNNSTEKPEEGSDAI